MALTIPHGGPGFTHCTSTLPDAPQATLTNSGIAVASGGSANADGTVVQLLPALTHDVHRITISLSASGASTVDTSMLLDIVTDPAGGTSWGGFIDDLICGYLDTTSAGGAPAGLIYEFPIYIKAGTSIGGRLRCATASRAVEVNMEVQGCPTRPELWWCGQGVESLGIDAANSTGTQITPANGSFSTFASIGTTTRRYGAIQVGIQGEGASFTGRGFYVQIGAGGSVLPGTDRFMVAAQSTELIGRFNTGLLWCSVPAGTALEARARSNATTDNLRVGIYGVY